MSNKKTKCQFISLALLFMINSIALGDFDDFNGVQFLIPTMGEKELLNSKAAEMTDGITYFFDRKKCFKHVTKVGKPLPENYIQTINRLKSAWGAPIFGNMSCHLQVWDPKQNIYIKMEANHDPKKNKYDFASEQFYSLISKSVEKTVTTFPNKWIMLDEPSWGYSGFVDPLTLAISPSLLKRIEKKSGKKLPNDVASIFNSGEYRYYYVMERNKAMGEYLASICKGVQDSGRKGAVNIIPTCIESSAICGFEIASVMDDISKKSGMVQIDPYYSTFMEDPRFAGFMLKILDDNTPADLPILGWLDSVDARSERLGIKVPPPESMKTQIASYLANGADHLAVWAYAYLKNFKNREPFLDMVRWVRANQCYYRGNPQDNSKIGIYFSNASFFLHDFFPRAWAHGVGGYGQYFDVLHTYYSTVAGQVPVQVITTSLEHPEKLSDKISSLKTLVLVNAPMLSAVELKQIHQWVKNGGTLIAIGACATQDEYGTTRPEGLSSISGISYGKPLERKSIILSELWPEQASREKEIPVYGDTKKLYLKRYRSNQLYVSQQKKFPYDFKKKHPMYMRTDYLKKSDKHPDPSDTELGESKGISLIVPDNAKILAHYKNKDVAIAEVSVDRGKVIHIAPVDLAADYCDPSRRNVSMELFRDSSSAIPVLSSEGEISSLEFNVTERKTDPENRVLIFHVIRRVDDDQFLPTSKKVCDPIKIQQELAPDERLVGFMASSVDTPSPSVTVKQTKTLDIDVKNLNINVVIMAILTKEKK